MANLIPILMIVILTWAVTVGQWGVVKWFGICATPAFLMWLSIVFNFWHGEDGIVGLVLFAYTLLGGTIVFFLGLAGYALYLMGKANKD